MSQKSLFYIVTGIVLIFLFKSLENVSIEFIKSTNEPEQSMPFFMMPGGGFQQQSLKLDELWANK